MGGPRPRTAATIQRGDTKREKKERNLRRNRRNSKFSEGGPADGGPAEGGQRRAFQRRASKSSSECNKSSSKEAKAKKEKQQKKQKRSKSSSNSKSKSSKEAKAAAQQQKQQQSNRPGGYAAAPNFHLHGNSDDDQADTISESESNCSEQWYELDGQEQEALISLRDARKKLQHATKSIRFYPKSGGRAQSTGKSIDELKKVTPCNRCGSIGHWEEDCTQPARSRKKRSLLYKGQRKKSSVQERKI